MVLPGSKHLGLGKTFLQRYPWWEFVPRSEPNWEESGRLSLMATGIPGQVWVIYLCNDSFEEKFWGLKGKSITIESHTGYRAFFFNPRTGEEKDLGKVQPDSNGEWAIPEKFTKEDLVLVLEKEE